MNALDGTLNTKRTILDHLNNLLRKPRVVEMIKHVESQYEDINNPLMATINTTLDGVSTFKCVGKSIDITNLRW